MRSTFFGFDIARKALFTSQRSLDVVAHNIANANTPGYSRQEAIQAASAPFHYMSFNRPMTQGQIGTGVQIDEIRRIRDMFLDKQYRREMESLGEWEAKSMFIEKLEGIFNEPSSFGIRTVLDQFWGATQDLSKNPENITLRELVLQRGVALTETIKHLYRQLDTLQVETNHRIQVRVDEVNTLAKQIADLNGQIHRSESGGDIANDLRDKRDLLIDKLSKLINIQVHENQQGEVTILANGIGIVNHVKHITIDATQKNPSTNLSELKWADTNMKVTLKSGEIFGLLEMRDNVIPEYMDKLNDIAGSLIADINFVHRQGYGLNNDTGYDFFILKNDKVDSTLYFYESVDPGAGAPYNQSPVPREGRFIPARDITINSDLIHNPERIAAASNPDEPGDGSNALAWAQLKHVTEHRELRIYYSDGINPDAQIYYYKILEGTLGDYTKSMIAGLGVKGQQAERMVDNQALLVLQSDNRRQALSGVSLDEEMTGMIRFQHSYNAAARIITAMDEMIEVIISRLGIVGR